MEMIIAKDADELSRELASWIAGYINKTLEKKDGFSLVLSGGSTPKKLYSHLAASPLKDLIDWSRIRFFWGDERGVSFSDERNNAKMAFDELLSKVPVKQEQIHPFDTSKDPSSSAATYEAMLREFFPDAAHTFDLVLLGLGDNAHTLSLFPRSPVLGEKEHWVRAFYLEEQEMYRLTLTAPVVNASDCIVFLVSGAEKALALKEVIEEAFNPYLFPAQLIQPESGELFWWVDEAAAQKLTNKGHDASTI